MRVLVLIFCLPLVSLAIQAPPPTAFPVFTDVAESVGLTLENLSGGVPKDYILQSVGNGAAFFDYDNDGDLDLLITNGSTLAAYAEGGHPMAALYENAGGLFRDVTDEAGIGARGWGVGVCVADFDGSGYQDFYLTAWGPNVLYRNTGAGFEEVYGAGVEDEGWSTSCAFADYDRDGDVDLYVANYVRFDTETIPRRGVVDRCSYMGTPVFCGPLGFPAEPDHLYSNNGDGTFEDVTRKAGIEGPADYGLGAVFTDFDNDGWPDLYVANDSVPNSLYRNDGDGTFSDVSLLSGTALSERGVAQSGMGIGVGDYDRNGYFDIFVTNFARDSNTLYRNTTGLFFEDVSAAAGLGEISRRYLGWGTGFVDLDHDGFQDLFVANGHVYPEVEGLDVGQAYPQRKEVYRNRGDGTFEEVASELGSDLLRAESARGVAFGDYDNDGDLDAAVVNMDAPPSLYRNEGAPGNWISLRLEGTDSNRDAIGARVEIGVGAVTQIGEVRSGGSYLSHDDMRLHFGLGQALRVDEVRVHWPSGASEVLTDLDANRFLIIREGQGVVGQGP